MIAGVFAAPKPEKVLTDSFDEQHVRKVEEAIAWMNRRVAKDLQEWPPLVLVTLPAADIHAA
jgi:hypothetical protein